MGYYRAGFDVVGVDIKPQPHYPFEFHQGDALEFIAEHGREFDVVHASPPCQVYGKTKLLANDGHPDLIADTRRILRDAGKPYIIENVPGAPLIDPVILNGAKFGLRVHRVRLFETSFPLPFELLPPMPKPVKMGRPVRYPDIVQPVGHFSNVPYVRQQMGINWMTQGELAQAIPPAYTKYIGEHLLTLLKTVDFDKETWYTNHVEANK
jgi:DNA (cytosine-5)-methyltransferase 1